MNWVGGVRNRLKVKNERKRQQEFFEKQKFSSRVKRLESLGTGSPSKRKQAVSLDILALQAANFSATKFQKHDSSNKKTGRIHHTDMDKSRGPFGHKFVDLPDGSPEIKPSRLALDMPSPLSSTTQQIHQPTQRRLPPSTVRIPDESNWQSAAKRPTHLHDASQHWTSTPIDPWNSEKKPMTLHSPLTYSSGESVSSLKDFKIKKEPLYTHHATSENLLLHGMHDRERMMETIEEESHWSSPRMSHGSGTSGISGMSPISVATDTSDEATAASLDHHGLGSSGENTVTQKYFPIPEIQSQMAESNHDLQQSGPGPSTEDGLCLQQDSSLSSFKDYHRIIASKEASQTRHCITTRNQTNTAELALERDHNFAKIPAPTRNLEQSCGKSISHLQQQKPMLEKDLACHENTQFTSPEDTACRPYLMKENAKYLQAKTLQEDIPRRSSNNQRDTIPKEPAEMVSSAEASKKCLDQPDNRDLKNKWSADTDVDIFKLYSTKGNSQLTSTSKQSSSVGINTPLALRKSASSQSRLLPASLSRIQSCQEAAQLLESGMEDRALASLRMVTESRKEISSKNQMSIGRDTCATCEDSCSSSEDAEDTDADISQSSDDCESLGGSVNHEVGTQQQDPVPRTECNWLGFVTGTTTSQQCDEHHGSRNKLDRKKSGSDAQIKIRASSATAQQMLQEVLALDRELQIDDPAEHAGTESQTRLTMPKVLKERGLEQMATKYDQKMEQTGGVVLPQLQIKQSMISEAECGSSSITKATEVQTCMRNQNYSNNDIIRAAKEAEKTSRAEQNMSEGRTNKHGEGGKVMTPLHNSNLYEVSIQTNFEHLKSPEKDERPKANEDASSSKASPVNITNGKVIHSSIMQKDSSTQTATSDTCTADVVQEHSCKILTPVALPPKAGKVNSTSCITPKDISTQTDAIISISSGDKHSGNILSPAVPTSTSSETSSVCDGSVQCMLIGEPLPMPEHLDTDQKDIQHLMSEEESLCASTLAKNTFCDSTMSSQEDVYDSCHST